MKGIGGGDSPTLLMLTFIAGFLCGGVIIAVVAMLYIMWGIAQAFAR